MKESKSRLDSRIIWSETFNSLDDISRNWWTATNVTVTNGTGSFNGTNSKIVYGNDLGAATCSIRVKFKSLNTAAATQQIVDLFNTAGGSQIYINSSYNLTRTGVGTLYSNGIVDVPASSKGVADAFKEVVLTGTNLGAFTGVWTIGINHNGSSQPINAVFELVEIYSGTLTATEVASLYKNELYKAPNLEASTVLDINPALGYIQDRKWHTVTNTAVNLVNNGSQLVADHWNTTNISVANSSDFSFGTGAGGTDSPFSIEMWIKMTGSNLGNRIFIQKSTEWSFLISGQWTFQLSNTGVRLGLYGSFNPVANRWYHIVCTYDGSKTNAGLKCYSDAVLAVWGNYNAGVYTGMTPSSNWIDTISNPYPKQMGRYRVFKKELTLSEIQREYQSQKNLYR